MRIVLLVIAAFVVVSVIAAVYAGPVVLRARRDGRTLLVQGRNAVLANDLATAKARFTRATAVFGAAETRLRSPLFWPVRIVPVASTNLVVTRDVATIGREVAGTGYSLAASLQRLPGGAFKIKNGTIPLGALASAGDALDAGAAQASTISDQVAAMPSGWALPPVAKQRAEVRALVPSAADAVTKAQAALHGLPSVLGLNRRKRYLVAFSNLAELRGSGGLIGYVTALDAAGGRLQLEKISGFPTEIFKQPGETLSFPSWFPDDFRTQAEILQNINLTTDFPTVGNLLLQATASKTKPMDGVIGIDPEGVAAVLALTGPIHVPGWRPPITAGNVAQTMQHDVYTAILKRGQRDAFFGAVVRTAFAKLTASNVVLRPKTIGAFDAAVQAGHFRMFSADGSDQSMFQVVGLAGNVDRASGASDALSVVSENSSGNKEDWYLTKSYRYRVVLDPRRDLATTFLDVRLHNAAPSGGLPDYVIGTKVPGLARGTNRSTFMLVRSGRDRLERFGVNTKLTNVLGAPEGQLRAYRTGVLIEPGGDARVQALSTVPGAFFGPANARTYRLRVMPQAMAHPDTYDIRVTAASGWHVVGPVHLKGTLTGDLVVDVRVAQTRRGYLFHLLSTPFRAIRRLF